MELKKTRAKSRRFLAFTLALVSCFCVCISTVFADIGPKPSVFVTVKNAPSKDYYVAFLYYDEYSINPKFSYDEELSEEENMAIQTIFNYNEDWFNLYSINNRKFYKRSSGQDDEEFEFFQGSGTFKIMVVTLDGQVQVSNAIRSNSLHFHCIYDWKTNTLMSFPLFSSIPQLVIESLICCAITVLVEYLILLLFKLDHYDNIKPVIVINLITQTLLFVFNIIIFLAKPGINYNKAFMCMEFVIMIIEAFWYAKKLKTVSTEKISVPRNIIYAVVANFVTAYGISLIFRSLSVFF